MTTAENGRPPDVLDRVAAIPLPGLLVPALVFFVAASFVAMVQDSVVYDEVVHLPSGYTYLTTGDFRLNPEHPPLIKSLAAIPLVFLKPRWPSNSDAWTKGDEWAFGFLFMYHSGNNPDRLLFWGRAAMLIWPLLLIVAVTAVARELFGPRGGLIALVLTAFNPTLLFLTLTAFWKLGRTGSWTWAAASGLLLGGALAAKFNAVLFLPPIAMILAVAGLRSRSGAAPPAAPRFRRMLRGAGLAALVLVLTMSVPWAAYGFRFSGGPPVDAMGVWSPEYLRGSMVGRVVTLARTCRLMPEDYLYGFSYVHQSTQGRLAYAMGQYTNRGWWWYFPFCFLVKTPLPAVLLMGWGVWTTLRRFRHGPVPESFLVVPVIFYWVLAIGSGINIGVRHLMPVLPLMAVLAGGVDLPAGRWWSRGVLAALGLTVAGCAVAAPHYLSYFNLPSRMLGEPHELLVDSNLDWGQDLKRLKSYMEENRLGTIKLAYFGAASPRQLNLVHEVLPSGGLYREFEPEWKAVKSLRAGDLIAVSATVLSGALSAEEREYYRRLVGKLEPIETVGRSIFIYRLSKR